MTCPGCGTTNAVAAVACSGCGRPLPTHPPNASDPDSEDTFVYSADLPADREIGRRYRIIDVLGKGGMGTVYLARDRELDRDVALKVIRPHLAEDSRILERFKREIQLSSKVTHRNVLRVHDLGQSGDLHFLTMEYVRGRDLATLLKEEGRPVLDRALKIFREICEGLAVAHEQQVLHRDLKPQNILVDQDDHVHITDFGLAKSLEAAGMTETGAFIGTPHYMAPEQVKGETTDKRADIYALGVVLYELLTGSLPFKGGSAWEVALQRLQGPPVPATELNPQIPRYLQQILERCMTTDKTQRYASVEEILSDLETRAPRGLISHPLFWRRVLVPAVAGILLIGLAWAGWRFLPSLRHGSRGQAGTGSPAAPASVVGVVPFDNRTGRANLDWYGGGLARLVMDNLAQSSHVRVVSAESVSALKSKWGGSGGLIQAAAADGIGFLISGEIVSAPGGLTVAARMTETGSGHETASRRIDGLTEKSLIGAADGIGVSARKGLGLPPAEGVDVFEADFLSRNPDAYEDYLKGLEAWTGYRYGEAEEAFRAALEIAPDYTMARYRLAQVLADVSRTDEALTEIRRALAEATRLPDREAQYVRAAEAYFSRRYDEALKHYRELVERYPYDLEARDLLAVVLKDVTQYGEAAGQLRINAGMEPDRPVTWSMLGDVYLAAGDFNQAVLALRRYLELEPASANGHHLLGDAYRSESELNLAAAEYAKALEIDPTFHYSAVSLAEVDVLRGRGEDARHRLLALVSNERAPPRHRIDAGFDLAALDRAHGRFREAARVLERLESPLHKEKVREAMALSTRGTCSVEVGDLQNALTLIEKAEQMSPGVPTRYLFARGLLELRAGNLTKVRRTAAKILEGALPPENPSRTAEKAAAYLTGLAWLAEGDPARAIDDLSRAVALSGYEYAIYRVGLGRAYLAAGKLPEALAAARQSATPLNPADPRLDLELDRVRAGLLLAMVHAKLGQSEEATTGARSFLQSWSEADRELPDLAEARTLVSLNATRAP